MLVLGKIAEFLIKKHWVIFLVSLVLGMFLLSITADFLVTKMPFRSREINIVLLYACWIFIVYLLVYYVSYAFAKRKDKQREMDYVNTLNNKKIEAIKTDIDKWMAFDYSVVMYLLEHENKKPYVDYSIWRGESILDNTDMFVSTSYSKRTSLSQSMIGNVNPSPIVEGKQYLLKEEIYQTIKYILENTGSISHFGDRPRIDLEQ